LRERSPDHKGESRVIRDYDQEEAGFESSGDIKKENVNKSLDSESLSHTKSIGNSQTPYFLSPSNVASVKIETGYDGSHVMDMNISNQDNKINYCKDQEYNNYNGKSRDNRLTTVHEDTREAMGTEDMEISNSP